MDDREPLDVPFLVLVIVLTAGVIALGIAVFPFR
jgi:hypothetical protein